jgi:hypothetical protein
MVLPPHRERIVEALNSLGFDASQGSTQLAVVKEVSMNQLS